MACVEVTLTPVASSVRQRYVPADTGTVGIKDQLGRPDVRLNSSAGSSKNALTQGWPPSQPVAFSLVGPDMLPSGSRQEEVDHYVSGTGIAPSALA